MKEQKTTAIWLVYADVLRLFDAIDMFVCDPRTVWVFLLVVNIIDQLLIIVSRVIMLVVKSGIAMMSSMCGNVHPTIDDAVIGPNNTIGFT
jgi:hypothetical protein